jgi:FtsP/CotA-like multicopper oxidase with cupredoxin domain
VSRDRIRLVLVIVGTLVVLAPLAYFWQASRLPSTYSVEDMGYLDYGGGPGGGHAGHGSMADMPGMSTGGGHAVSVADLVTSPDLPADVTVELTARQQTFTLSSGQRVEDGYTLNGSSPGPLISATQGQVVEVHLHNQDVKGGVTLHWHGVDVPNGEDGVAGVTQDAVRPGGDFTYRFVANQTGTYWYHSHQVSHEQVIGGLLGPLVIHPKHPDPGVLDEVALAHTYDGVQTLDGRKQVQVTAAARQRVRVRVINTDNGPTKAWASAPYKVVAVDGHDVNEPTDVTDKAVVVTAGGRIDLEVTVPSDGSGVRVQVGSATAMVLGPDGVDVKAPEPPQHELDLLSYGSPAPIGLDPSKATRHFRYDIGRRPGFVKGVPGLWWSVNGHLWPHLPMFVVAKGDVVQMTIKNSSGDVHPMHLHGHHAVVLSRDGVKASGSPWWFDSLNVKNGETFVVAFVADNPGIWMDHCHNLKHAQQGLVTHLMYEGVSTPFRVGTDGNEPE